MHCYAGYSVPSSPAETQTQWNSSKILLKNCSANKHPCQWIHRII